MMHTVFIIAENNQTNPTRSPWKCKPRDQNSL